MEEGELKQHTLQTSRDTSTEISAIDPRMELSSFSSATFKTQSLTNFFKDMCPFLMSIGQSRDEFWYGDPSASLDYIQADELRQDRENHNAWLQGFYISQGMEVALLNSAEKKAKSQINYLQTVQLLPRSQEQLEEMQQQKQRENYETMKTKLMKKATTGGQNGNTST